METIAISKTRKGFHTILFPLYNSKFTKRETLERTESRLFVRSVGRQGTHNWTFVLRTDSISSTMSSLNKDHKTLFILNWVQSWMMMMPYPRLDSEAIEATGQEPSTNNRLWPWNLLCPKRKGLVLLLWLLLALVVRSKRCLLTQYRFEYGKVSNVSFLIMSDTHSSNHTTICNGRTPISCNYVSCSSSRISTLQRGGCRFVWEKIGRQLKKSCISCIVLRQIVRFGGGLPDLEVSKESIVRYSLFVRAWKINPFRASPGNWKQTIVESKDQFSLLVQSKGIGPAFPLNHLKEKT